MIFVREIDDAGVKILFEKEICRIVQREMVLLKGFCIGTLYKIIGITIKDRCNNSFFLRLEPKKMKIYSLYRKDYVVASKTRKYQREGPSSTT
jgi:hypothetical protein